MSRIVLSGEKVTEINRIYREESTQLNCKLNVGTNGYSSDIVLTTNWCVCKIDNLADMITELTELKEVIERETGLIL